MANSSDDDLNSDNDLIDLKPLWRDHPFLSESSSSEEEYAENDILDIFGSIKFLSSSEEERPMLSFKEQLAEIKRFENAIRRECSLKYERTLPNLLQDPSPASAVMNDQDAASNKDTNKPTFVLPAALAEKEKKFKPNDATRAERTVFITDLIFASMLAQKKYGTFPSTPRKQPNK